MSSTKSAGVADLGSFATTATLATRGAGSTTSRMSSFGFVRRGPLLLEPFVRVPVSAWTERPLRPRFPGSPPESAPESLGSVVGAATGGVDS